MICRVCGGELPPRHRSICSPECKASAEKARASARYRADRDAWIARSKAWKHDHLERARELARDYGMRHRNQTRQREAEYRAVHRDRYSAHVRDWYRRNGERSRELGRLNAASRRARILGNGSYLVTERDLRRTLIRFDGRCAYCGKRLNEIHWDHVVPVAKGGSHGVGNLVPACPPCNQSKSSKLLAAWRLN